MPDFDLPRYSAASEVSKAETVPSEWQAGLDALRGLPDGAAALLVGPTDRGKTTFAALAARLLAGEIGKIAVVDADVGQSEIGPPGCVGWAGAKAEAARLRELKPAGVFWVGAFAPNQAALELVVATSQAVSAARASGAKRILVDTTGYVIGPGARRLKAAKAQVIRPALILGFGTETEIAPLVSVLQSASGAETRVLAPPESVGRKPPALRATHRLTRLSQALENARDLALPFDTLAVLGATLGTGTPLAPHLVEWAGSALRLPVTWAEQDDSGVLTVFVSGPPPRTGWEAGASGVTEHFGAKTIRALSLKNYENLYLGLHDGSGRLVSVGRFTGLDALRGEVQISASVSPASAERIRMIAFGRVRVGADGSFISEVKPGEI